MYYHHPSTILINTIFPTLYFLGYSETHFTICATCLSTTACTPAFAWAFLNRKSEQWKPPGITLTGAFSVETSGPPGRNSEDIPEVFHGSNCLLGRSVSWHTIKREVGKRDKEIKRISYPLVQIKRSVSSNLQPWVCLLTL